MILLILYKYTKKEKLILNQYKNGPYHTMITNLTEKEHLQFVNKLIDDNDLYCVIFLTSIYTNYNQKFLIDYFIKCDDIDMLVNFLNTCNDFWNALDQKYIVDSILKLKNKNYVKKLLNTKCLYFLTNEGERKKLEDFIIK
ncbi:MAG: hypothetical protein MR265_03515 [Erysipelotrichaceae bacterium]|nr:hypothetical protein [Erysipelotrichaceae bacterium]